MLYPFHHLDTLRKHERLVSLGGSLRTFFISGPDVKRGMSEWHRLEDKTILYRFPASSPPPTPVTKGNLFMSFDIVFDEAAGGFKDKPVVGLLRAYAERVAAIIKLFDAP